MENEIENTEKSGEKDIYENNLVLCPLLLRARECQVHDSSEEEAEQAYRGENSQNHFLKLFLLLICAGFRAIDRASDNHLGNLSGVPFYQVVDAERVDHFAKSFFFHNLHLQPPIISYLEVVANCLANLSDQLLRGHDSENEMTFRCFLRWNSQLLTFNESNPS